MVKASIFQVFGVRRVYFVIYGKGIGDFLVVDVHFVGFAFNEAHDDGTQLVEPLLLGGHDDLSVSDKGSDGGHGGPRKIIFHTVSCSVCFRQIENGQGHCNCDIEEPR